jgi:CRISPR-associated endonuclease/helicase Cas3
LLSDELPEPEEAAYHALPRNSWRLAGLTVLADWLGSNAACISIMKHTAATGAISGGNGAAEGAGGDSSSRARSLAVRNRVCAQELLNFKELTPLQQFAETVESGKAPQTILFEDVTGAGKTEAAFLLAYRLMAERLAQRFYFALPTMTTAYQLRSGMTRKVEF